MGIFLSMTGVPGRSADYVSVSLRKYAEAAGGGLRRDNVPIDDDNCFVLKEADGNTTIFNSYAFLDWDALAEALSRDLGTPVFSFHIHDGDFWMYTLYANGEPADRFNPIPDYWGELEEEEIAGWSGNASTVARLTGAPAAAFEKYLVRWDLTAEEPAKAYPEDDYAQEDFQLLDFMRKLRLPNPLQASGDSDGDTYRLRTKTLPLCAPAEAPAPPFTTAPTVNKSWWKFW